MYERVYNAKQITQRDFFNKLNDTQDELAAKYAPKYLCEVLTSAIEATEDTDAVAATYKPIVPITKLDDAIVINPLYHTAIVSNILFLLGEKDKQEFILLSNDAYINYWKKDSKGRVMRRRSW